MGLKESLKPQLSKLYERSESLHNSLSENLVSPSENVDVDDFQFNSTNAINVILFSFLLFFIFIFDQTHEIISFHTKYIRTDPIVTTLLMCLTSFAFYTYSRFVRLRRREILKYRNITLDRKDDVLLLAGYTLPLLLQMILLFQFGFDKIPTTSWFILLSYSSIFITGIFAYSKNLNSQISFFSNYRKRINTYTIGLFILTIVLIFIYFQLTHIGEGFTSDCGIGPFDVILLILIFYRGVFAFLYYLFSITPNVRRIFKRDQFTNKQIFGYILIGFVGIFIFSFYKPIICQKYDPINQLETQTSLSKVNYDDRKGIDEYVKKWLLEREKNESNIYLVAGQGGGSRAGFWTASVLQVLDELTIDKEEKSFYHNCFAISSVSGSSVGSGIFINAKKDLKNDANYFESIPHSNIEKFFTTDFFSASLLRLMFIDPFFRLTPIKLHYEWNRNSQLVKAEAKAFDSIFNIKSEEFEYNSPLVVVKDSLFSTKDPLLFLNTYNVSKQKKSVIAPVKLFNEETSSSEDFLSHYHSANPITTGHAINFSQMFPFLSASAILDSSHYYDGGIYDNSGLSTIRDIYGVLAPLRDRLAPEKKIVVLYLQNSMEKEKGANDKLDNSTQKASMNSSHSLKTFTDAVSGSLFAASSDKHISKLNSKLKKYGDTLCLDFAFEGKVLLNRWIHDSAAVQMKTSIMDLSKEFCTKNFSIKNNRKKTPASLTKEIFFDYNSSSINAMRGDKIKSYLEHIRPVEIELVGYTDNIGSEENNKRLATQRADAVKSFLVNNGYIKGQNVKIKVAPNQPGDNALERQVNRRVELNFSFFQSESLYFSEPL